MKVNTFWEWFSTVAGAISKDPNNHSIISELDRRITRTWPSLSWEIGPDSSGGWYFALSPNLNRELADSARQAIASAPLIKGWKLYPFRQRKEWNGIFEIESQAGPLRINASEWKCVLLRYKDGHTEVIIAAPEADGLGPDERWQAAAIALEGTIGEECLLHNVHSFSLESKPDPRLASRYKPLKYLHCFFNAQ